MSEDFTESTRKEIVILEISRKLIMHMLDLEMVISKEENGCRFDHQRKEEVTCMVNSCQGKVAGVFPTKLLNSSTCSGIE